MREIKFRAWSNKYQHMFRVSEISQDRSGYTHGIVDAEFKNEFEPEFDSPFAWIGRVDFKKSSDGRVAALGQNPDDEPFYLMQYTGLKDKNGRDIYEGDVVKFKSAYCENKIIKAVVKFKDSLGSFVFNMGDDQGFWRMDASIREIEVIGNIYENPELLEAAE
ncbi:YopX family protein [Bacillus cabrialesii]|uniref:YopX family protein n=1 Tax=Bacillus cabrialesii subsp. tritici TaxID=2944916 RepID=A0ABT9DN68_9BACI|nr:YopX family protein [Bacillus cabrialesii]MDO8226126.1 YopX family protein [Bacillus cabrialesii subsp. tritici]